jgi:hypothetical protein
MNSRCELALNYFIYGFFSSKNDEKVKITLNMAKYCSQHKIYIKIAEKEDF